VKWYFDSSALLKTVLNEPEAENLVMAMELWRKQGDAFSTSVLSQVEVARSLSRIGIDQETEYERALSGMNFAEVSSSVIEVARSIGARGLRSLDAIHLATAQLVRADVVVTYDERFIQSCMEAGVATARPGVGDIELPEGWEWLVYDDPEDDEPGDWTDWA